MEAAGQVSASCLDPAYDRSWVWSCLTLCVAIRSMLNWQDKSFCHRVRQGGRFKHPAGEVDKSPLATSQHASAVMSSHHGPFTVFGDVRMVTSLLDRINHVAKLSRPTTTDAASKTAADPISKPPSRSSGSGPPLPYERHQQRENSARHQSTSRT
jgi:hypothetical protein